MIQYISARPFYKRIALHPITVMVLLCAGVFIVGSTFKAGADSLTVTATVHAQIPTQPAVITSFTDQHTTDAGADVGGTCPADTYVKVYRNDEFAGVAQCDAQMFHVQVGFVPGVNKLQARVYNITDDEGPQSSPITVYYDNVVVTAQQPPTPPTDLSVSTIDAASYQGGIIRVVGSFPTFTGLAPPFSRIVITIPSDRIVCRTVANKDGWWSCTFTQPLSVGLHTVEVVATTPDGRVLRFPIFTILVADGAAGLQRPTPAAPLLIHAAYRYQTHYQGEQWSWDVGISGGTVPYKVTIDWGDGTMSNRDRDGSDLFTISHSYNNPGVYQPTIRVVDAGGNSNTTMLLQLLAIVKPSNGAPIVSATTPSSGIAQYLWFIWPTYLAIVLMVLSFWLGELEVTRKLRLRRH
jgi:hypothetical protein